MTDSPNSTNPRDSHTEAQIRRALAARAEETTVSPDALDTIRRRSSNRWVRPAAYAAAAAVVAVIAGVAILADSGDADEPIDVAGIPTTVAPDGTPTTTGTTPPTSTTPPGDTTVTTVAPVASEISATSSREPLPHTPTEYARAGLVIWPLDDRTFADGQAAASDWASTVLGVDTPEFSGQEQSVALEPVAVDPGTEVWGLLGITEGGGPGRVMTRIVTASPDGGQTWVVTHALSGELSIDHVEQNTSDTIRVTGSGRAFEGTAHLTVDDGAPVLVQVRGDGEFDEFSVVAPTGSSSPTVIRVEGSLGIEDGVPDVTSFAATPAPRSTDIVVFGVAADDELNVRSGAGTSNAVVATLAPEETFIVHTGGQEDVDGERWWEIITADLMRGWVNSRYLSVQRDLDIASIQDRLIETTQLVVTGLDPDGQYLAPYVEIGGIGVFADWPTPFTSVPRDAFDEIRNWSPAGTEDRTCDCDLTVEEFLGLDTARWELAEYTLGHGVTEPNPGFRWSTGLTEDFYDRFATVTVFIPEPNPAEAMDWRRYTVVWEFEDGTPRIRGVWRWGWTP